jgi:hypothetical protein
MNYRSKKIRYKTQIHDDQIETELKLFWSDFLYISPEEIIVMKGRNWNCKYGVMALFMNFYSVWESLVIRLPWEQEIAGSNPVTLNFWTYSLMEEQGTVDAQAGDRYPLGPLI